MHFQRPRDDARSGAVLPRLRKGAVRRQLSRELRRRDQAPPEGGLRVHDSDSILDYLLPGVASLSPGILTITR